MDDPRSALGGAATQNTYIDIRDRGPQGQVTVKADLAADRVAQAVLDTTGLALPEPLKVVCGETGNRAVWMAPDEVLLLSDRYEDGGAWAEHLTNSTSGDTFAIDVSDARSVLALSGAHVAEVLAKGAPCDLGVSAFGIGTARRTHLGGLAVAIWRISEESWEVVSLRSYAHHLFHWFEVTGRTGSEVFAS